MKALLSILLLVSFCLPHAALAGPFDARAVFDAAPGRDIDGALKRAARDKKRVLLFSYDEKEGGNWPGLSLRHFMDLPETKKLVKENFILVLLVKGHKALDVYHPPVVTGSPFYVLINPDGTIVKAADTYGNPGSGLKAVKELIALPPL